MDPYDAWLFGQCQNHPKMECKEFEISGQITKCSKIETPGGDNNIYKGICIPTDYPCSSDYFDCPILVVKNENNTDRLTLAAKCNSRKICDYNLT